jgi:hypothetical protein
MFVIREGLYAHPVYLCEQGCEDSWLFFETKRFDDQKNVWETLV